MCFVSDNVSTKLPTPPELQPLTSRTRFWPVISYMLIIAGIIFLGWGGWGYFRNWYQTSNPPARIVESVPAEVDTPTAVPSPQAVVAVPAEATATPAATPLPPTATSSPVGDTAINEEPASEPDEPAPEIADTPAAEEESPSETALSLEDYPLPVDPLENEPVSAEPVPSTGNTYLTRIVAESVNLDSPVVEVGWQKVSDNMNVWTVAEYAAGWHKNSELPGHGGNIVLSGHHNIKGEVFRYIVDLEPGAVISLYGEDNQQYDYAVFDKFILKDKDEPEEVRLANARWIGPFNEERLTLVTCWPYNNNTHRVIVIAKPVNTESGN